MSASARAEGAARYLYVDSSLQFVCLFDDPRLEAATERHKLRLELPPLAPTASPACEVMLRENAKGIVIGLHVGWMGRAYLALAGQALRAGRPVWLYWQTEEALERVDRERLGSHRRHWAFVQAHKLVGALKLVALGERQAARAVLRGEPASDAAATGRGSTGAAAPADVAQRCVEELEDLIARAAPVPFRGLDHAPTPERPLKGCGVYLRTDFWARISSGGSYGHTCYVAKELAGVTEKLVCLMPHRYALLDRMGLQQVVLDPASEYGTEEAILAATPHYHALVKPALRALHAAYVYERLCLGNYVGARVSQELGIPYIVEYNGSEISMMRSFDGRGYRFEEVYLKAEAAAFQQATAISVVSEPVKADLVGRGVDPAKILVNPNGADLETYAPTPAAEKTALRRELGFDDSHCIIGFTGTFGGWHGVDVLAAALPRICEQVPHARFLIIGDGNYRHLVSEQVSRHGLGERVRETGRVPQEQGARLLGACDLYVSPHNSHMIDSRFFGSPTKIFEYMAMGGGIVASDLEQIGQVLSPALRLADLRRPEPKVSDERAVLCTPGDVDEFVEAVVRLASLPEVARTLGRNARQAVADHYSWRRNVANLWRFVLERHAPAVAPQPPGPALQRLATGDAYKDEVQRQWDNDPAGSHYVKKASRHTLEWFLEAEAYRYGEYAPWMPETMEFAGHAGEKVLEIGSGMGTDLSRFARHGAEVTGLDLSAGHLRLAEENFRLRGLKGRFIHHDAERLPFEDGAFDLVYSNGVLHHTPNTAAVVSEIHRVLRPGGRVIVMVYAENSLHYWRNLVMELGVEKGLLREHSMGEIMSRHVEISENGARPLVKVYTKPRLRCLFHRFEKVRIVQRQITPAELRRFPWVPVALAGKLFGWNLVLKARRPGSA